MSSVRVGVGCFVLDHENRFLIGRRISRHNGHGKLALPGLYIFMIK
jgi:hypothetical protein